MGLPFKQSDIDKANTKEEKIRMLDANLEAIDDLCFLYGEYKKRLVKRKVDIQAL